MYRPSVSRRQVLLFPICAHDELTPPIRRSPPGPRAGCSLAEGTPKAFLCPGTCGPPGFDDIIEPFDASAVVYSCSSSRRIPDSLEGELFPQRSPPRLLTDAACGGLRPPPAGRSRGAIPHLWCSITRHLWCSITRRVDLLHRSLLVFVSHNHPHSERAPRCRTQPRPGRRRAYRCWRAEVRSPRPGECQRPTRTPLRLPTPLHAATAEAV